MLVLSPATKSHEASFRGQLLGCIGQRALVHDRHTKTAHVYDSQLQHELATFPAHDACLSDAGDRIATVENDEVIVRSDEGRVLARLGGGGCCALAIGPRWVVKAGYDSVELWRLAS